MHTCHLLETATEVCRHVVSFLTKNESLTLAMTCSSLRNLILTEDQQEWLDLRAERLEVHQLLLDLNPSQYKDFRWLFRHNRVIECSDVQRIREIYEVGAIEIVQRTWLLTNPYEVIRGVVAADLEEFVVPLITACPDISLIHLISRVYLESRKWSIKCFLRYMEWISQANYYHHPRIVGDVSCDTSIRHREFLMIRDISDDLTDISQPQVILDGYKLWAFFEEYGLGTAFPNLQTWLGTTHHFVTPYTHDPARGFIGPPGVMVSVIRSVDEQIRNAARAC